MLTVRSIAHQTTLTTKRPPSVMPVSMQRRSALFAKVQFKHYLRFQIDEGYLVLHTLNGIMQVDRGA